MLLPCHIINIAKLTILSSLLLWLILNEVRSKDPYVLMNKPINEQLA